MAVLTPRTVLTLAAGIGIGAALAHRRAAAAARAVLRAADRRRELLLSRCSDPTCAPRAGGGPRGVRARVRRLRRDRSRTRSTPARSAAIGVAADVRAGHHGDDLRDRAPLGRAHQPGRHDRLHAHAALPAARRGRLHRRAARRRDRRRVRAARRLDRQAGAARRDRPSVGAGTRAALRGDPDRVPDVRDHRGGDRHARGRRGGRDRDRRHGRPRRAVRRADHRRVDEPGALVRPGARVGRRGRDFWIYLVGPDRRRGARRARLPAHPRRAPARARRRAPDGAPSCSSACTTPAARR